MAQQWLKAFSQFLSEKVPIFVTCNAINHSESYTAYFFSDYGEQKLEKNLRTQTADMLMLSKAGAREHAKGSNKQKDERHSYERSSYQGR